MGRKFFVGGNWKMNGDKASIEALCNTLKSADTDPNVGNKKNGFFVLMNNRCERNHGRSLDFI